MDPNTLSITEAAPRSITISLSDIGGRFLTAMQRTFETAAYLVEGTREVTERTYDDFLKSARFVPSQKDQIGFDGAREEAARQVLRWLLTESLTTTISLIEDCRSVCAISQWKKAGQPGDQAGLQTILKEDRKNFLALSPAERLDHLQRLHGVQSPFTPQMLAINKLAGCLANSRGVVSERDVTSGGELSLGIMAVQDLIQEGGESKAKMTEVRRRFSIGDTVKLEKSDYLGILTTISIFGSSIVRSTQEALQSIQAP